ncbi:unnamed protein product [Closterium sp. NIES-53]
MREDLRVGRAGDDRVWTENWSDASTSGIDEWRVAAVCTSAGQPRAATGDTHPIPFSLQVMREVCKRQGHFGGIWSHWYFCASLLHVGTSARGHFCTWALLHVGTSARGHFCTWALRHVGTSARGRHFGTGGTSALGRFCTWSLGHGNSAQGHFGSGALQLGGTSARGRIGMGTLRRVGTSALLLVSPQAALASARVGRGTSVGGWLTAGGERLVANKGGME